MCVGIMKPRRELTTWGTLVKVHLMTTVSTLTAVCPTLAALIPTSMCINFWSTWMLQGFTLNPSIQSIRVRAYSWFWYKDLSFVHFWKKKYFCYCCYIIVENFNILNILSPKDDIYLWMLNKICLNSIWLHNTWMKSSITLIIFP